MNNEFAVSEVVGFIIILGLVITGIGLVTLYGYPILLEQQANANIRNMERNMIVLQSDIKSLTFKSVPYRETTMQVNGGALFVEPESSVSSNSYFTLSYPNASTGNPTPIPNQFSPGEIRYEDTKGQAVVALENGAVHMRYWGSPGSTMLSDPRWFVDDNPNGDRTVFINLIRINTSDSSVISKEGLLAIQMTSSNLEDYSTDQDYKSSTMGPQPVTVTYTHDPNYDYDKAWINYFSKFPQNTNIGTNTLNIPDVDRLVIKAYEIDIINL